MKKVRSNFKVAAWEETPFLEMGGGCKLTQSTVTQRYLGEMEGESHIRFLTNYNEDGTATYVGLERFSGKINGLAGCFVMKQEGEYQNGVAHTRYTIVPGTGTDALKNIAGKGSFTGGPGEEYAFELEYTL